MISVQKRALWDRIRLYSFTMHVGHKRISLCFFFICNKWKVMVVSFFVGVVDLYPTSTVMFNKIYLSSYEEDKRKKRPTPKRCEDA